MDSAGREAVMGDYLILKLQGVMQCWGEHTFEGLRPSADFPTRSGLLGLLGACLGIHRQDKQTQQALADSIRYAVRRDRGKPVWQSPEKGVVWRNLPVVKLTDYHTVKDARESYRGLKSHDTIQTWREYLLDAAFTVAIWNTEGALVSLDQMEEAVKHPRFTPFLGRRSCPLGRPLFEARLTATNPLEALRAIAPHEGIVYSEADDEGTRRIRMRDVPLVDRPRQFTTRMVTIHGQEVDDVSQ